ncbi:MAG: amino acid ABC transporter ATP-binding protein [Fusobacteriaceae bacterium]
MKLKIENLIKKYEDNLVLDNLNLNIDNINSLVIIGPSGGGKSTLVRILAGLENPDSGKIKINDEEIEYNEKSLSEYRKTIGLVFQAFNLFPHLTALENITLPLEKVHKLTSVQAEKKAISFLTRFGLKEHMNKKPGQLSGGQQQRVAITRAITLETKLLILDEPTSALDPALTSEVLDIISELKKEGKKIILVTHSMNFAKTVADKIIFVAEGKVIEEGGAEIIDNPKSEMLKLFLNKTLKY